MTTAYQGQGQSLQSTRPDTSSRGWALFGGILLTLLGIVNVIQGITLLQYDDLLVNKYIFDDITFWGWAFTIFGALQAVGGALTIGGTEFGPKLGIVLAGISVIGWFFMIFAAPAAAVVGMAIAVAIIASLTTAL